MEGKTRLAPLAAAALAAVLALACGGAGEDTAPSAEASQEQAPPRPEAPLGNEAPVVHSIAFDPPSLLPGQPVKAVVDATDPEGHAIFFRYAWTLNGQRVSGAGPVVTLPRLTRGDRLRVEVEAADKFGEASTAEAEIRMGNRAPRVLALEIESATDDEDREVWEVAPSAEDPDRDRVAFDVEWIVNDAVRGEGEQFPREGLRRGDVVVVRVTATDGTDRSAPLESAPVTIGNRAPDILSRPPGLDASGEFVYVVEAEDPDGDEAFHYELTQAPEGMTIDAARGELRWKPGAAQAGSHVVEIAVDDGHGAMTKQRFKLAVRVEGGSPPASP